MPKRKLYKGENYQEGEIIDTLIAGHRQYRPDLSYPESYSDMQGAVRGLLQMFEVRRRDLPEKLKYECGTCEGLGSLISLHPENKYKMVNYCPKCDGRGYMTEDDYK